MTLPKGKSLFSTASFYNKTYYVSIKELYLLIYSASCLFLFYPKIITSQGQCTAYQRGQKSKNTTKNTTPVSYMHRIYPTTDFTRFIQLFIELSICNLSGKGIKSVAVGSTLISHAIERYICQAVAYGYLLIIGITFI